MISGRRRRTTDEKTEHLKPGTSSAVTAAPPTGGRWPTKATVVPARARDAGAHRGRRGDAAVAAAADDDRVVAVRPHFGIGRASHLLIGRNRLPIVAKDAVVSRIPSRFAEASGLGEPRLAPIPTPSPINPP